MSTLHALSNVQSQLSSRMSWPAILTYFVAISSTWMINISSSIAQQPAKAPAVEQKILTTADGWNIAVDYYSQNSEAAPVVIVVHGENSNALAWKKDYGEGLQALGYAVACVDLRMHGNSKTTVSGKTFDTSDLKPNEYASMIVYDLEVVKSFLLAEHQKKNLNIRRLGIIASDNGVPLALNFADVDWNKPPYDDAPTPDAQTPRGQDVHAIAMISPVFQLPGVNSTVPLRNLTQPVRRVAFFSAVGKDDSGNNKQSERFDKMLKAHTENAERVSINIYDSNQRGVFLATRTPQLKKDLIEFLDKNLMKYDVPWQDRRSRLER